MIACKANTTQAYLLVQSNDESLYNFSKIKSIQIVIFLSLLFNTGLLMSSLADINSKLSLKMI